MKKYAKILLILVLTLGFSACEDEDDIRDSLYDYDMWIGYLGFSDHYDDLESGLQFNTNGFGKDFQVYYHKSGERTLDFAWRLDGNRLTLDYGDNFKLLEIRYLEIRDGVLAGTLYVDGEMVDDIALVGHFW